jgi:hypothetical protein
VISRPSLVLVSAILGALVLTLFIQQTPLTDDFGYWSARLDPLGNAMYRLQRAPAFVILPSGEYPVELQGLFNKYWRLVAAQPNADSLFRHLYLRAKPAGRLYALLGLYYLRSRSFRAALAMARTDSAPVPFGTPSFLTPT